ncbi:2470_t:CDS:2 [Dentiscutata erythropus]|uniref:2470_t:CDS:1 n=1 Tax=Dentiscutata erythropus TaxID=1348616 RepID=A0A9N9CHR8_9GLOM|nr:2470_t:CDS:2 [Dentiscutata erythropus]
MTTRHGYENANATYGLEGLGTKGNEYMAFVCNCINGDATECGYRNGYNDERFAGDIEKIGKIGYKFGGIKTSEMKLLGSSPCCGTM